MRIVTRPDFDGVVSAVFLKDALHITEPVLWVEPNDMQHGRVEIQKGDIIANLPYHPAASMWFDHHFTNRIDTPFEGDWQIAPSAAGLVHAYFKDKLSRDYGVLVAETDKIDSAALSEDEVLHPEAYPYVLLSMTLKNRDETDPPYWDHLTDLLLRSSMEEVMADPVVARRCETVVAENRAFTEVLTTHTRLEGTVSVVDLRSFDVAPSGNRFLVYSMFPAANVSVKIRYGNEGKEKLVVSVGHSIFNRTCRVNVGDLLSRYGGGGHPGAGACSFPPEKADIFLPEILKILQANVPEDSGTSGVA